MPEQGDPDFVPVACVQRVRSAGGHENLYLRKKGYDRVALSSPWGTQALADEVAALLDALAPDKVVAGTLKEACRTYELKCSDFRNLGDQTKAIYRAYLSEFIDDMGSMLVTEFSPAWVLELKNAWADRGHRAANMRLQVLHNVLKPAMIEGKVVANVFELVGQVRRPPDRGEPHLLWPMAVVDAVIGAAIEQKKFGIARAIAIGRFVGPRRGDIVKLTKAARLDGRFKFRSGKRRVDVDQHEDPLLTRWLAQIPDHQPNEPRQGRKAQPKAATPAPMTLVFNLANRPYTEDGLGQELRKLVEGLFAEGKIDSAAYDLHGLRHTRGVEAALAGCTDAEGAALLGHGSPHSFAPYRRQADRIRLGDNASAKITELRATASPAAAAIVGASGTSGSR